MTADGVMSMVRAYASGVGVRAADEQEAAYLAIAMAVQALTAPRRPEAQRALAWAVLDANDNLVDVERSRVIALDIAEGLDGHRIAPLVLADLDDVDEDPS